MTTADLPEDQHLLVELRRLIHDGTYPAGKRLPSIRLLSEQYGIDKNVVERVIGELRNAGLVETRQGSGTYVRSFAAIPRVSPNRLARERWIHGGAAIQDLDTASRPRAVDVRTGEGSAPDWAAAHLNINAGENAAYRSRLYTVDDRRVQIADSWYPADLVRGTRVMHTDPGPGGSWDRLTELGVGPVRVSEHLRARMPSPGESASLSLPPGTPVIEIIRPAFDESGRCVEVNRMVLDAMAYLLVYHLPV